MIEYSDNYSDTSGGLWQLKRDEVPDENATLIIDNSQSFKYKAANVGNAKDAINDTNGFLKNTKLVH